MKEIYSQMFGEWRMYCPELSSVPEGLYNMGAKRRWWEYVYSPKRFGWVGATYRDDDIDFVWTSSKNSHMPLGGPALSLSVRRSDGFVSSYMESALTMHIKWGYGYGGEVERARAKAFAAWLCEQLGQDPTVVHGEATGVAVVPSLMR